MSMSVRAIAIIGTSVFFTYLITIMDMKPNDRFGYPRNQDIIKVHNGYLYCDSLVLSIKEIPKLKDLHTVSTHMMGKWNRLFTAIKIEESGYDAHQSYYAKAYFNLTGMRFPQKRKTTAIRKGNDYYAVYLNWYEGMLDFKYYLDYMEGSFFRKNGRLPENEKEFINHIYGSFNIHGKWKRDVFFILDKNPLLNAK